MNFLRILYQDDHLIGVEKPSGFHTHAPEDTNHLIHPEKNSLKILRNQTGKYLYPVHRLDAATSGVLLYALDVHSARQLSTQFTEQKIKKTYFAVIRGWMLNSVTLDYAVKSDPDSHKRVEALTEFIPIAQSELPIRTSRHPSFRFSLVKAIPKTGRYHQIRQHLAHLSHPILGDAQHGDTKANKLFSDYFGKKRLWLQAHSLELTHPILEKKLFIHSRWKTEWHTLFDQIGVCPLGESQRNKNGPSTFLTA